MRHLCRLRWHTVTPALPDPCPSGCVLLQVVVNTYNNSISHLGGKLSRLQELNLNGSVMESVRDLGTGFQLLQVRNSLQTVNE